MGKQKNGAGRRRSKAEAMTGAKASSVEVRGGDLGLPQPVEIASGDFQTHYRAIKAAIEKKDTANALLRGCYKAAKALHPNLPDAIRKAIAIERVDDPSEVKAELEVLGIALRETNCPVQLTVFDTLLGDPDKQAYARGFDDGKAARAARNPFPDGSPLAGKYADGWRHGTAANLGISPDRADAAALSPPVVSDDDGEIPPFLRREQTAAH